MSWQPWKRNIPRDQVLTGKRARVWTKTAGRCGYCGCALDPSAFHIDHVIPKRLGGSDDFSNLLACCVRDNLAKGSLTVEEYRSLVERRNGSRAGRFSRLWRRRLTFYFEEKRLQLDVSGNKTATKTVGGRSTRSKNCNPGTARPGRRCQRCRDRCAQRASAPARDGDVW